MREGIREGMRGDEGEKKDSHGTSTNVRTHVGHCEHTWMSN